MPKEHNFQINEILKGEYVRTISNGLKINGGILLEKYLESDYGLLIRNLVTLRTTIPNEGFLSNNIEWGLGFDQTPKRLIGIPAEKQQKGIDNEARIYWKAKGQEAPDGLIYIPWMRANTFSEELTSKIYERLPTDKEGLTIQQLSQSIEMYGYKPTETRVGSIINKLRNLNMVGSKSMRIGKSKYVTKVFYKN